MRWAWAGSKGRAGLKVAALLVAALYTPVFSSAVQPGQEGRPELALALAAYLALSAWRSPPWAVVLGCAGVGRVSF